MKSGELQEHSLLRGVCLLRAQRSGGVLAGMTTST